MPVSYTHLRPHQQLEAARVVPAEHQSVFGVTHRGEDPAKLTLRQRDVYKRQLPHWSLFVILIVAIVAAWLMIFRGINARPWQPDSPLANA